MEVVERSIRITSDVDYSGMVFTREGLQIGLKSLPINIETAITVLKRHGAKIVEVPDV